MNGPMATTHVTRHLTASRSEVYAALLDRDRIPLWRVPRGMTCVVHEFEAVEGGRVRVSLTYDEPGPAGKTTAHTDTYRGRFVTLVPDELVVEVDEFETSDPGLRGEMTSTIRLADDPDGGTVLTAVHEDLPPGLSPADNEAGWREALDRLAELVESPDQKRDPQA